MAETGHAKNLENFKKDRDFAVSWGAAYTPSNPLLRVSNLNAIIAASETSSDTVQTARTPFRAATAAAEDSFAAVNERMTRVRQTLKASGARASTLADADTYFRKIKGKRASKAVVDNPATPAIDESDASHSASQMSRAQRIESLEALILLLEAETLYNPNEADLTTAALNALLDDLRAKTDAVQSAFVPYSNALAARDQIYYADATSLVAVASLFRAYVQAAFGRNSSQWAQIKDQEFRKYRRR